MTNRKFNAAFKVLHMYNISCSYKNLCRNLNWFGLVNSTVVLENKK